MDWIFEKRGEEKPLLRSLSRRLVDLKRAKISKRAKEAVTAYKAGSVKSGKFSDLWKDLND